MSESMQATTTTEPLTLSQKAFRALFGKRMAAFEGIPGPTPSLPAGNGLELLRRPVWEVLAEYGERYGELCVIWLLNSPTVVVSSPELIWQVLEGDFANYYKQTPRKEFLPIVTDASEFIANGDAWATKRANDPAILTRDPHRLRGLDSGAIRQAVGRRMDGYVEETHHAPFRDVVPPLMRLTFDVFCIQAVGRVLERDMFDAYTTLSQVGNRRLSWPVTLPFALTPGADAHALWQSTFESLVKQGKRDPDSVGGILRMALQAGSPLDDSALAAQIGNVFFGGLVSVASGVINTLYLLTHHPEVGVRVAAEARAIDARLAAEGLQVLDECPELDRAVLESLRLLAPVPIYSRRTLTTKEVTLGGHVLPADTNIYISCWGLHRSATHWTNPEQYDPGRWLNGVKEANPLGSGYFFPFGRGRRACVGGPLGLLSIKLVLASILASCRPEVGAGQTYDSTFFFGTMFPKELKARFLPL
jgi:cytochrome P450